MEISNFPSDQDSEILVRERARGTKLEDAYKRRKGTIIRETPHTIALKESNKKNATVYSKREIARPRRCNTEQSLRQQFHEMTNPQQLDKPTTSGDPIKTKKPKGKTLPKQFQGLANWEQLKNEETDEEEQTQTTIRKN